MERKIKAAILGCTGYTGLELIKIIINHKNMIIDFLGSQNNYGHSIDEFDSSLKNTNLPKLEKFENINFSNLDVVFFALPHNLSQNIIKNNFGKCVFIDLSADFRINDPNIYKLNYGTNHTCQNLLKDFTYGLAEINSEKIIKAKNIAVPGCYPTSILIPLIPLIKENFISTKNIIIDSKSGYSGAGKNFDINNLINNKKMNFYNYKTNDHRHICEIHQELKKINNSEIKFSFNPHILPIFRGMMSTIYCDLNTGINKNNIIDLYNKLFSDKIFIKILKDKENADFFSVNNTNNCLIKIFNHYENNKIIIVSLIDNLVKGASGQAI